MNYYEYRHRHRIVSVFVVGNLCKQYLYLSESIYLSSGSVRVGSYDNHYDGYDYCSCSGR